MEIESINTRLLTPGQLKVKVIKVKTPTLFWVHIDHCCKYLDDVIEELTRQMMRWGDFLLLPPDKIKLDDIVAVREGEKWQRGIVSSIEDRLVRVTLRDWSRTVKRPIYQLYELEDRFRKLEWQAIPCGLAHIRPTGTNSKWPRKVNKILQSFLKKRESWMRIQKPIMDEAAAITLIVKRAGKIGADDLKDMLIQKKYAEFTDKKIISFAEKDLILSIKPKQL